MDPNTSVNKLKNKDIFSINPEEMAGPYGWNSQNYSEKITDYEAKKSQYGSQEIEEEIICKSYDPHLDDFIEIDGVAYNINKKGLVFRTDQSIEVGDPIFIKAKYLFRKQHNHELDEGVHAKVIWCKKTFNQKHKLCYEVGVEYFK